MDLDPTSSDPAQRDDTRDLSLGNRDKSRWERIWPALACGAGLFSDGYLNTFVISFCVLSAYHRILTFPKSHRTGQYDTRQDLWRRVQKLLRPTERCVARVCWHRYRAAVFRLVKRSLFPEVVVDDLDLDTDRLCRALCGLVWLPWERHGPFCSSHCLSVPYWDWHRVCLNLRLRSSKINDAQRRVFNWQRRMRRKHR